MSGELWQMARNGTTLLPGEARKLANAYDKLREERDAFRERLAEIERELTIAQMTIGVMQDDIEQLRARVSS